MKLDFDLKIPTHEDRQLAKERAECEASLIVLAMMVWGVLEPGRKFVDGWHLRVICAHLEAVASGLIKRLLITMPPRHMKSLLVSVIFPIFCWLKQPSKRFIVACYDMGLSLDLALKMKRIIESEWFQARWGHRIRLKDDQGAKGFFENEQTGYRYSTSIVGGGTGRGADIGIFDDPHNTKNVESDNMRRKAHDFYHSVMSTRGNDPETFAIVCVGQRTHEDDLFGHLEQTEILEKTDGIDWQWVDLPARAFLENKSTILGAYDPRTVLGQLLWPERFTQKDINILAKTLGPYREAAQLDQKPTVPGGGMFKKDNFILEHECTVWVEKVRAWDIAATEEAANEDPDFTAGVLLGRDLEGEWWVLDVILERTEETDQLIIDTAKADGYHIPIALPKDPGAAGKLWVKSLRERMIEIEGFDEELVRVYDCSGSKVTRASSWAGLVKQKKFHVLIREWTDKYIRELVKFWTGKHDDQVDGTSLGYEAILTDGGGSDVSAAITSSDLSKLPGLRGGRR